MKKLISITLALILLTSQLGFAVATHFCGGFAVESKLILGHEHIDCGMSDMDNDRQPLDVNLTQLSKGVCCQNDYQYLSTDDNVKTNIEPIQVNFFVIADLTSIFTIATDDNRNIQLFDASPPLLNPDLNILHQVFRI